jgi:pimeloyl-ACP methyl ester carboxylesterase/DNA-binding CsgD family transcriptional regulator
LIDELSAVVDHLELPRFGLLCNSVSASVGIAYAVRHPERVSQLICVNASARGSDYAIQPFIDTLCASLAAVRTECDLGIDVLAQVLPPEVSTKAMLAIGGIALDDAWAGTALAMCAALRSFDVSAQLASLCVPTLIVNSRGDRVLHFSAGVELASRIPNAHFVAIDGHAHSLFRGAESDRLQQVILEFLQAERPLPYEHVPIGLVHPLLLLSPQQARVLKLIAEGKSNREIAESLVVSERTAERHIADVYDRLNVHNRAQATAFALRAAHA